MTNDSALFNAVRGNARLPLYEGKMIWQFDHRLAEPRYWVGEKEGREALLGRDVDEGQELGYETCRFAVRAVSASTNERSLVSTVVPPRVFCGNSLLVTKGASPRGAEMLFFLAVMNSLVVDAMLRTRVTTNINMFFLYQLPIPRPLPADPVFGAISERAARLICTTPEFDHLAKAVGLKNHREGATDFAGRAKLRAELDGLVAHLYGLTEEEFAHVLTTFPLVPDPVKIAARNAYRDVERGLLR